MSRSNLDTLNREDFSGVVSFNNSMKDMKDFYEGYWGYRKEKDHLYSNQVPGRLPAAIDLLNDQRITSILDVGCGEGTLGQMLGGEYKTVGVDISEQALEMASEHYDSTKQMNVEDMDLSSALDMQFDAVVCMELLEHVFQPKKVLQNIRTVMHDDSLLITSFPNFVFWKHRLDMIKGKTPQNYTVYSEAEHIQNFTFENFGQLIEQAGFTVDQWYPQYSTPKIIPVFFGRIRPSLFASQVVVAATPDRND